MAFDQTLVQIRERSYLDLLDLALVVVRHRPWTLALAAAAGIAPFALLNQWLQANPDFLPGYWPILLFLEAPWATAPLTIVLGGLMFDQPPPFGSVVRRLVIALPSLIFVHVFLRGLLGATVFLIPLIPGRLWFVSEVILLEKTGGLKALGRSARLSASRSGEFFIQWIGQLFFGIVFALCFWAGTSEAISVLIKADSTWSGPGTGAFGSLKYHLGVWIAIAFFAVARFLVYIDQRIRSEGWELRLRLQAVGRDLEGGRG
jgi:hypothetical protein